MFDFLVVKKAISSKLLKSVSGAYVFQLLVVVFGFVNVFLITKFSGIFILGQHAILSSTVGFMALIVTARSGEAVVKFYGAGSASIHSRQNSIFYGFVFDILTAVVLFFVCYFSSDIIAKYFLKDDSLSSVVVIFSLINVLFFLKGAMSGYLQARDKFFNYYAVKLVDVFCVCGMLLFYSYGEGLNLDNVVYSYLFGAAVSLFYLAVVFSYYYLKEFNLLAPVFNRDEFFRYFKFNLVTFTSSALKAGNQNFDNVVASYFLPAQIIGVFSVIKKFFMPVGFILGPVQTVTYPKLNKFWVSERYNDFKKLIFRITFLLSLVVSFYIFLVVCFSGFLSELFSIPNESYVVWVFFLVGIYFLFNPFLWWTRNFSNVVNPNFSLNAGLLYTGFQVVLLPLGAYFWGLFGILIVLNVLRLFLLVYWIFVSRKVFSGLPL